MLAGNDEKKEVRESSSIELNLTNSSAAWLVVTVEFRVHTQLSGLTES